MLETFRNAWKVEDLRKKIIYTLIMLLIYRVGSVIPTPGVNVDYIAQQVNNISMLGMLDFINGQNFSNFTIFAMGISPYITSSIIMQLLTIAIPSLERLQKEGEEGRKKIAEITRVVTIALGCIMALGIILGLGSGAMAKGANANFFDYALVFVVLAAGTAFTMWIGERITENGIGNGVSLLIFVGIIASFPGEVFTGIQSVIAKPVTAWFIPLVIVGVLLIIVGIVFVDSGVRRVPVQYAKRQVGRKMYGGQASTLPMKVNMSGVLPIIFAQSIAMIIPTVAAFLPAPEKGTFAYTLVNAVDSKSVLYMIVYFLMIIAFSYFYATIQFNPVEISNNLKKNGGFIPGFRPGKPTADFIKKVLNKVTLFGAIYLGVVAILPLLIGKIVNVSSLSIGGTSVIIVVGVALETVQALESQMLMRQYKGFLE